MEKNTVVRVRAAEVSGQHLHAHDSDFRPIHHLCDGIHPEVRVRRGSRRLRRQGHAKQ